MTSNTTLSICTGLIALSIQTSHAFQKGVLSKEEAAKQIEKTLNDYSHENSQIGSLDNFIRQVFGSGNVTINPVTEIVWLNLKNQ